VVSRLRLGDGLVARTQSPDADETPPDVALHRGRTGPAIDFSGKSVLRPGLLDGYWSFYAERRGAASVLASDDATQNWAGKPGA